MKEIKMCSLCILHPVLLRGIFKSVLITNSQSTWSNSVLWHPDVLLKCTISLIFFSFTLTHHCPRFTHLSYCAMCFNQTDHHQAPICKMFPSHYTCFMQTFYDTLNVVIMLKLL